MPPLTPGRTSARLTPICRCVHAGTACGDATPGAPDACVTPDIGRVWSPARSPPAMRGMLALRAVPLTVTLCRGRCFAHRLHRGAPRAAGPEYPGPHSGRGRCCCTVRTASKARPEVRPVGPCCVRWSARAHSRRPDLARRQRAPCLRRAGRRRAAWPDEARRRSSRRRRGRARPRPRTWSSGCARAHPCGGCPPGP